VALVWSDFAEIAGSASGALTGLLFVAVSLNRERVTRHPGLRSQAGQTLVLFLLALITSLVLVIPGTPSWALGLELVVVAVVSGVAMGMISQRKRPEDGDQPEDLLAQLLDRVSPNLLTMLLILVAGCIELAGADGLYVLAPAIILALGNGVVNAWLFLTE
jgi:modulator of FtsH protease